jgi:glycerol-3-phosphate acyltransferase PlsX
VSNSVTVALDAMGGDNAPAQPVLGALAAAGPDLRVILVGDETQLTAELDAAGGDATAIEILHAPDYIASDEEGARAVRSKPDSSVAVACRTVREGRAQAVMSAGHTGAMMAASILHLRRIRGVLRPGIAVVLPSARGRVVLIDAGANAEAKSEHLAQFAHMGRVFARDILGVADPSVGLLSIGEEAVRGSDLVLDARARLEGTPGFFGNVEGRDIPAGTVDVVVTDGFTGNVALKAMEGTAEMIFALIREAIGSSTAAKVGGLLARPALRSLRSRLDPDTFGGAYLLGVNGISVIGHGNSSAQAVTNALHLSARGVRLGLLDHLAAGMDTPSTAAPEQSRA